MSLKKFLLVLSISTLLLIACSGEDQENIVVEEVKDVEIEEVTEEDVDLSLRPNELGQVMVLMYHNIGEEEREWTRTYENFRRDLETLYNEGYRALSLEDYVKGNIDVEAGMTPVIITFDDGNENNFRLEASGDDHRIDEKSAIGVLEKFKEDYPDFNTTASFFTIGKVPFGQEETAQFKLDYLIENGYDIGNHTIDHRNMSQAATREYIEEALGGQVKNIQAYLPEYNMNTYAICYGARPKDQELYTYLSRGQYEGTDYENIAILNVGWNPSKSPFHKEFDPLSIPRIRASETKVDNVGLYDWLEYFRKNPDKRFISDGYREIISLPKDLEEALNQDMLLDRKLNLY